ncbi:DNA-directed RNA polymerase, alpha subunit [Desulfonatronospira thiodismutans ASO3-1]|uniref:DNA-directed RNA polymerase subunit alpha n=1 Tax=Desulfonatronospira thiodismutans ASO3-1 TaxID=555779 RepID=D6SUK8_9BACT|nr:MULTISPECIES: DNA-directed RNA polymerase subunit alpha [Desulfonatronospira]EFI32988.1 DNA-directed RNA polymerase, alpha subunit [Desulfonatronospira thiodismutans ASO3-1]RQD74542.1 MAG: DNA-directed RNA polymerase subunit alpha [Desulfonatronospira sp. MSAO_Bac3]
MIIQTNDKLINTRNWSSLVKPDQVQRDEKSTEQYGKFSCEPLERGFGNTFGNALRRILLSSLQGAAIVAIKIDNAPHEFATITGVVEDVTDIVLNLKQVRFKMSRDEPQKLKLVANEKGQVTAKAIQTNQNIAVLNPDQHIATLSQDIDLVINIEVRMGKGYVPSEQHEDLDEEIGLIPMDATFSPIRKVSYTVEQARVGQMTNYDKLILEIHTDGSVLPEDALAYSAKILKDQLSVFINFDESQTDINVIDTNSDEGLDPKLFKTIEELELPVRAGNCLRNAGIRLVGELIQQSENDLLRTKNFGRKSLEDIRRVIEQMGYDFNTQIDNFDQKYQEWLKRKEDDEA